MARVNPSSFPVERGKIHEFANAILSDDPLFHDEPRAREAGLSGVVAPPTYTSVDMLFNPDLGDVRAELDMRFVLHGSQVYEFERPLFAGDTLTAREPSIRRFSKQGRRGGEMHFVETTVEYEDAAGALVVRVINTLIQTERAVS